MTVVHIRATAPDSQPEVNSAWRVYQALATYRAANPEITEDIFYTEVMNQAHNYWSALFQAHK